MSADLELLQATVGLEPLLKTELAEGHDGLELDPGEFLFTGLFTYGSYGQWLTFTTTPGDGAQEWYWPLTGVQEHDDKEHPLYETQGGYSELIVGLHYRPGARVNALFVVPTKDHAVSLSDRHAVAPASWVFETFGEALASAAAVTIG